MVPDAVRAFTADQPLIVRNPAAIRPWQYILDPLRGYARLAEHLWDRPADAAAFNFGPPPDHELDVRTIVQSFAREWGGPARWQAAKDLQFVEAPSLRLDSTRAQKTLGWRAMVPIQTALARSAAWYREFYAGSDAAQLMHDQISAYEAAPAAP